MQHELNDDTPCVIEDLSDRQGRFTNNYFDGLPVRGIHAGLFFIIMAAYFFEQFDNWNFGFVAPRLIEVWGLKPADIGTILFWYFIGMTPAVFWAGLFQTLSAAAKPFLFPSSSFPFHP